MAGNEEIIPEGTILFTKYNFCSFSACKTNVKNPLVKTLTFLLRKYALKPYLTSYLWRSSSFHEITAHICLAMQLAM